MAYMVSTVVAVMPDYRQRQHAWSGTTSLVFLLVSFLLFNLATVLLVVRDPPGIWLTAGLLYLIASIYGLVGWAIAIHGVLGFFTPLWGFVSTAAMTSGALAGVGLGAAAGVPAGAALGAGMAAKPAVAGMGASGAAAPLAPGPTAGVGGVGGAPISGAAPGLAAESAGGEPVSGVTPGTATAVPPEAQPQVAV